MHFRLTFLTDVCLAAPGSDLSDNDLTAVPTEMWTMSNLTHV